jgi:micrococcal nuclease
MVTLWAALLQILLASAAVAVDFSGPVVSVLDGDTIEVLHNTHPERIRLNGIDCPEKGQAFGKRAKQAASALVFGKEVILQTYSLDKYKRAIADVTLPDGTNVNHVLVKEGWRWWYRRYAPGDTVLEGLENEAREGQKGLWAGPAAGAAVALENEEQVSYPTPSPRGLCTLCGTERKAAAASGQAARTTQWLS